MTCGRRRCHALGWMEEAFRNRYPGRPGHRWQVGGTLWLCCHDNFLASLRFDGSLVLWTITCKELFPFCVGQWVYGRTEVCVWLLTEREVRGVLVKAQLMCIYGLFR
jgi:hypothetical protein